MMLPEKLNRPMPSVAGLYWARKFRMKWWNYIVRVEGTAPMLHITWAIDLSSLAERKLTILTPGGIEEWGPQIECIQPVQLSDLEKE